MKRFFILLTAFFFCLSSSSQLQSPEQFLGYSIGFKFTPHWRVVDYFRHVAASVPSMVKLQQYGQTNEGRPLLAAFVSSTSNISNLEGIRTANLSLADGASHGTQPAIVWLSYNVHGNEASSTEASMLTIYQLVNPGNNQTKQWLQNTVVVIDPCLNPDGRDRYASWFNSVKGKNANPSMDAREHKEPWPGGRVNHYYFDLNRDWAWQTQVETQQRLKLYNDWLPQIHVDFHEQFIENPYYFAPAAQPYHEVITQWQRNFQNTIGRNHAKYFDEQGWLYFTKEYFDLLYPSYGDTYPIYNGSIGMTYEQAGHGAAGTASQLQSGDTLTLADRALHHFTTGMSTIEIASQNAAKLLSEFQNYFKTAKAGVGDYKTFVLKNNAQDGERINSLISLLQKNRIKFGTGKAQTLRGFNYDSGKEENFTIAPNDILISTAQQKGVLAKVLFEPNTVVVDSATYDITAWSLPYAYGLKAYAVKSLVDVTETAYNPIQVNNPAANPYGYIIRWNGVQSVKLVSQLLQKGVKLRFTEQPFESGGQSFSRGSVIVLRTSNQNIPDLWNTVRQIANTNNVQLTPVNSGFVDKGVDFGSAKVHLLKKRRVALLTGSGTSPNASGEIWHFFDQVIDYPITLINVDDAAGVNWYNYDVIIMPNGNYNFLNEKASADKLKDWISNGGNLIALESAVSQLSRTDWAIKSKKTEDSVAKDPYSVLKKFENRERDFIPTITPGSIFKVELDNTHPLAFGYPNYYYTLKQDDNIYDFIKEGGWNVGILKKDKQIAGFVGSKLINRLQDGLLFGTQSMGNGNITYLTDDLLFRSFWENGKLMFSNAVFLVGQ